MNDYLDRLDPCRPTARDPEKAIPFDKASESGDETVYTVYYYHRTSGPFIGGEFHDPLEAERRLQELKERASPGHYTTVDIYAGNYDELHRFIARAD